MSTGVDSTAEHGTSVRTMSDNVMFRCCELTLVFLRTCVGRRNKSRHYLHGLHKNYVKKSCTMTITTIISRIIRTQTHATKKPGGERTCSEHKLRGPFPWVIICLASLSNAPALRYLPASTLTAIWSTFTAPSFLGLLAPFPPPLPLGVALAGDSLQDWTYDRMIFGYENGLRIRIIGVDFVTVEC